MPDDTRTPADPSPALPAFTPVPRQCERSDGWTPERQRLFIEALADYGSVRAACDVVGLATVGAYRLRRQPGAEEFAAAWEAALAHGVRHIEDALMDRALNGVEVPVYSYGKLVGSRRTYNDRLGMFMLRNRAPDRFAVGGGARALNAVGKMELERQRQQWREEWEEERRREAEEKDREVTAGLIDTFEQMHRKWYAGLSRAARAAYRAFRRIERDDRARRYRPGDDETAEAEAEYDAGAASLDGRAKINLIIEADGYGVDEVLASDEARAEETEGEEPDKPDAPDKPEEPKEPDGGSPREPEREDKQPPAPQDQPPPAPEPQNPRPYRHNPALGPPPWAQPWHPYRDY